MKEKSDPWLIAFERMSMMFGACYLCGVFHSVWPVLIWFVLMVFTVDPNE